MYLKFTDVFKDIQVENAIASIDGVVLSADHVTMTLTVNFKASDTSEIYNTKYLPCTYDADGGDIIAQGYSYLTAFLTSSGATEI